MEMVAGVVIFSDAVSFSIRKGQFYVDPIYFYSIGIFVISINYSVDIMFFLVCQNYVDEFVSNL